MLEKQQDRLSSIEKKKKEVSDRELKNMIIAAQGSFGNLY